MPAAAATGRTTAALLVQHRAPGVWFGIWPALVAAGAILALALQAALAVRLGLDVVRLLQLSALGSLLGLIGAKSYYLLTHRSESRKLAAPGMSVQGFVLVAVVVLVLGSILADLPVGAVLDVTAPSLLVGMAVGRLGCLFAGCCVGRPTASRWGLWSSDRRVGVRRIPVQLLESGAAAVLAALSLTGVLVWGSTSSGVVFLESIAAYIVVRQLLFPLRALPRVTMYGRKAALLLAPTMMVAGLAVVGLR